MNRGSRNEIDVFPGRPLDNALQGNVVDICPVGALLDKDFLFRQRVWTLQTAKSISPVDSQGQAIFIDYNDNGIHRIRPRFNEKVNEWWISDEARFGWKHVHREDRLSHPRVRSSNGLLPQRWEELPDFLRKRFADAAGQAGDSVAVVLSPMMSCEEAWLLAKAVRDIAPQAVLVRGLVPVVGEDRTFPKGFVVRAEKCPNRRGIETVCEQLGGTTADWGDFLGMATSGKIKAAYVVGGYPNEWLTSEAVAAIGKVEFLVVQDLFPTALTEHAAVEIPSVSWAEREGTFMNCDGLLQEFERALNPLEGTKADGQFFFELAGNVGLFRARKVRAEMAAANAAFGDVFVPQDLLPKHAH